MYIHREESSKPLLPFDHIISPSTPRSPVPQTAILYVSFENADYRELHELLYASSLSPTSSVQYVLRYVPPASTGATRNYLTGYGVGLDLKKMDYLALDDRNAAGGEASSTSSGAHLFETFNIHGD